MLAYVIYVVLLEEIANASSPMIALSIEYYGHG